ncbi:MAG: hypothetical protein ACQESP_01095 [Candidatus Muiribacteriota bacterium]
MLNFKRILFSFFLFFSSIVVFSGSFFELNIQKPEAEFEQDFYLFKSWEYKNPEKIIFKDYFFFKRFELETDNEHYIEIRKKDGTLWYSKTFEFNQSKALNLKLDKQEIEINLVNKSDRQFDRLFLSWDAHFLALQKDDENNCYFLKTQFPVKEEFDFYITDGDDFYFGPVEYKSDNIINREIYLEINE